MNEETFWRLEHRDSLGRFCAHRLAAGAAVWTDPGSTIFAVVHPTQRLGLSVEMQQIIQRDRL